MTKLRTRLTWNEIAKELGTTPRSLLDWRAKFPDAPQSRDVAAWRAFMQEFGLGPYSLRLNAPPLPPEQAAPDPAHAFACIAPDWSYRRDILFELTETVNTAYLDGQISIVEFHEMGNAAADAACALAIAWKIPKTEFDPEGFRHNWREIVKDAARKKNTENKAARG